ncbi:MAG: hypothetical protein IKM60_02525 [Clostridia bacterium]|nr:hypothetical protein [Clostridia bacterium]
MEQQETRREVMLPRREVYPRETMPMRSRQRGPGYGSFDITDAPQDMQTYLMGQLGRRVTAHFVTGGDQVFEVHGLLHKVGRNFLIVWEEETGNSILCDLYSLRFVRVEDGKS